MLCTYLWSMLYTSLYQLISTRSTALEYTKALLQCLTARQKQFESGIFYDQFFFPNSLSLLCRKCCVGRRDSGLLNNILWMKDKWCKGLYELFDIKIVVLESALHKDAKKYSYCRNSEYFAKEHKCSLGTVKQNWAELCFGAGTLPYFVKQLLEVSRSAVWETPLCGVYAMIVRWIKTLVLRRAMNFCQPERWRDYKVFL